MECILACFMLFILSVVLLFLFVILPSSFASYETLLRQIAKNFSGAYHHGQWFKRPHITFRYGKLPVLFGIEKYRGSKYQWLKLVMKGSYPLASFQLLSQDLLPNSIHDPPDFPLLPHRVDFPLAGGPDVEARSIDATVVPSFAGPEVQTQLEAIAALAGRSPWALTYHQGMLTIHKRWLPGLLTNDFVMEFLREALRVHDQFLLSRAEGIKFADPSEEAGTMQAKKCTICGDELGPDFVQCKRCLAPHHLDCWNYNGSCGTFACKETRYLNSGEQPPIVWYRRLFGGN